eukprot:11449611-Alexandrium_andersonii.AAC.1
MLQVAHASTVQNRTLRAAEAPALARAPKLPRLQGRRGPDKGRHRAGALVIGAVALSGSDLSLIHI